MEMRITRSRNKAIQKSLIVLNNQNMSHIAVERNRRRQMNEHLKVLRSLTPCFYIKRGDQASIIGGVIEFIKELHQVLQSLESKKQRKSLSPSPGPSPRSLQLTPPQLPDSPFGTENVKEFGLGACCNSLVADVEAKISGSNVILRTVSRRIPGQIVRIINVLEKFSFEILHLNISSMEDTVLYSFVIKIGLECQLSVEELALEVQKSFCSDAVYVNKILEP
ncbi:Transcription factor MUTE [Camellia lanceoleosa]|uniref:Transcription factor MUTE n=1 Tax=Camellia lanceoleosa TaxID=1840588 RepID=A0ACC0GWS3_9ERIC|nr:Transcription factor MUTE [Camellia lanceoleosa]